MTSLPHNLGSLSRQSKILNFSYLTSLIQFGDRYIHVKNNEILHLESLKNDFVRCMEVAVLYRSPLQKMFCNIFGKLSGDRNNVY